MKIIGVDPGTAITGYGVLDCSTPKPKLLECGVIRTSDAQPMHERLEILYDDLSMLLKKHQPDWMVIEQLFFARNVTTAIVVGQARGIILLAGAQHKLSIAEYTPLQVKQAVTGYGKAKKPQVQQMVKAILGLNDVPKPDDAADAVAIALTHAATLKNPLTIRTDGV